MQPWIGKGRIDEQSLKDSLKVLEISRGEKKMISSLIDDYTLCNGLLIWKAADLPKLQKLVQAVIGLDDNDFMNLNNPEELKELVKNRLKQCSIDEIKDICFVLTSKE